MQNLEKEFERITKILLQAKKERPKPWIAAFDADGTLWNTDLGEVFFDYQIRHCGFHFESEPWKYYEDTKKTDTPKAYLWLAQISKGQPLKKVQAWAEEAFLEVNPFPFLKFHKSLIEFLLKEEFEVYIVTASVKWAVEPGARRLGVSESNVLGITTKVIDGHVTEIQDGPITWRKGKAEALLKVTGGVAPIYCAGNTLGDAHLLELATHASVAVLSHKAGQHLHKTEMELQDEAVKRNWIRLDLTNNS